MKIPSIAVASFVLVGTPAVAQSDDFWMNRYADGAQAQFDYTHTLIGNRAIVQKSVDRYNARRGYARNDGGSVVDKKERARQTCVNGRRMQAHGDTNPGLDQLAQLCAKAGF